MCKPKVSYVASAVFFLRYVMNQVENVAQLSRMSIGRLKTLLGNDSGAKDLWNFFHNKPDVSSSSRRS